MENTSFRELIIKVSALVLIIGGLYVFFRVFDISDIRTRVEEAGAWGPFIVVMAKASTIVIAPLTGSPIYPIAGALFGFWKAFLLLIAGDALGGAIAFYLSRFFGRSIVERMLGGQENLVAQALSMMSSVRGFLLARLCFTTFPEVPAYAGGLSRIPFLPFIVIYTLVGSVPTAFTTALGSFLTSRNNPLVFGSVFLFGAIVSGVSLYIFIRILQSRVDNSGQKDTPALH